MKKLKAREQHKCSYCSKPAEWKASRMGNQYSCVQHKLMLKFYEQEHSALDKAQEKRESERCL